MYLLYPDKAQEGNVKYVDVSGMAVIDRVYWRKIMLTGFGLGQSGNWHW